MLTVRRLQPADVALVARIDRTEHVDVQYQVVDGQLATIPVRMADIPPWSPTGDGDHTVANQIAFYASAVDGGGVLLGAFEDDDVAGLAIVDDDFEPPMAWLAALHVSKPFRRRGAASLLWAEAESIARAAGNTSLYVSASSTGSAVGFYLSRGCVLADPVHPRLFAEEPVDIHLTCAL